MIVAKPAFDGMCRSNLNISNEHKLTVETTVRDYSKCPFLSFINVVNGDLGSKHVAMMMSIIIPNCRQEIKTIVKIQEK